MVDIPSQGEAPFYESEGPLCPQNNPNVYSQPIQVNQTTNINGSHKTYKTPRNTFVLSISIVFLLFGILDPVLTTVLSINDDDGNSGIMKNFLSLIFFIIGFVFGSTKNVSSEIKIIPTFAIIEVLKKKLFAVSIKEKQY